MAKTRKEVLYIVYSDLHIELWKKFNEKFRRTNNAFDVLKQIRFLCKRYKCSALFLGDLLHKEKGIANDLLSEGLPKFKNYFGNDKYMTYAITGNHDQSKQNIPGSESPSYIKTLSKTFDGIECIDFQVREFEDHCLWGVPYLTHDIGLIETINEFPLDSSKVNILMLHTTMPGSKDTDDRLMESHIPVGLWEKTVARFDIVLSGHIHKPQFFKVAKTDIIQVGAPQHQRLTDRDCDMGYWIIYKDFSHKFVPFKKYPRFVEIKPGEVKPDNKNFYVVRHDKKLDQKVGAKNNFNSAKLSKRKLARNYCKEVGIKNKAKKKALINVLKETSC